MSILLVQELVGEVPRCLRAGQREHLHLSALGETQAAQELARDTLARMRRVLGEDHPITLLTATSFAECLDE